MDRFSRVNRDLHRNRVITRVILERRQTILIPERSKLQLPPDNVSIKFIPPRGKFARANRRKVT